MIALRTAMRTQEHLKISPLCCNCAITGSGKILGIPAGIRTTMSDAITNFLGPSMETGLLKIFDSIQKRF